MVEGYRAKLELFRFATIMTVPVFLFWLYSRFDDSYKRKVETMFKNISSPGAVKGNALEMYMKKLDEEQRNELLKARTELLKKTSSNS